MKLKPFVSAAVFTLPVLSAQAASLEDLSGTVFSSESGLMLLAVGAMVTIVLRRSRAR